MKGCVCFHTICFTIPTPGDDELEPEILQDKINHLIEESNPEEGLSSRPS